MYTLKTTQRVYVANCRGSSSLHIFSHVKVNNPYYERFFPVPANERREPEMELKIAVNMKDPPPPYVPSLPPPCISNFIKLLKNFLYILF
jgi:hypothetical protein